MSEASSLLIVAVGESTSLDEPLLRLVERGATILFADDRAAASQLLAGSPDGPGNPARVEGLDLDPAGALAMWQGRALGLSPSEVKILALLAEQPRRTFSFADIQRAAWGRLAYLGNSSPVRSSVKRLRRKLQAAGAAFWLESVRGVGFRLIPFERGELTQT